MAETSRLPEDASYTVKVLVDEAGDLTSEAVSRFSEVINASGIGSLKIKQVKDIQSEDVGHLSVGARRALNFSNSVIVDAGPGIGALIDATPREEQEFVTNSVNRALYDAGLIPKGRRAMKMGASGAVVEEERGAEVIELTIFDTHDGVSNVMSKAKAAWSDAEGRLHVDKIEDDRRVILENQFLVEERTTAESNALAVQIDVENADVDLYQLIANAAREAGLEDYTVRCTIEGPIQAKMAVIKHLPAERIETMDGVKDVLVQYEKESDGTFHFTGSRTAQVSRQNVRWGEITGNPVYSPNGHHHGYSVDGQLGGHVLGIKPQAGSRVMMIVEPARVVQVA